MGHDKSYGKSMKADIKSAMNSPSCLVWIAR